jgi:hypothetical protein
LFWLSVSLPLLGAFAGVARYYVDRAEKALSSASAQAELQHSETELAALKKDTAPRRFVWGAGVPLFLLGLVLLGRTRNPEAVLLIAAALILPVAISWAHLLRDSWPFYWNRYFMPVIPCLYLPVAVAMGEIAVWLRARRFLLAVPGLALVLLGCSALPGRLFAQANLYSMNCQNISEMQVATGRWIAKNIPPGQAIAANDAGAIRFLSDHVTVDLISLNNHEDLFGGFRKSNGLLARAKSPLFRHLSILVSRNYPRSLLS